MNSLVAFGIMAAAGAIAALIYDVFRASRRAMNRVLVSPKTFKHLRALSRPVEDVLSVIAAFLIFLIAAYICCSGAFRSYIILGFLCGILLYAGLLTHVTGNLVYGIFCALLRIVQLFFVRIPRKVIRHFRRSRAG